MLFRKTRQFLIIAVTVITVAAGLCSTSSADDAPLPISFLEQNAEEESERESLLVHLALATVESAFHDLSSLDTPLENSSCIDIPLAFAPHHERGPPVV